ncbi:ead/Ea22-like family protein [Salmonella enterica subsp. enterica serovar Agama]|nr:ead/Ea22-like family protein [Salmonella enterica]EDH8227866.1 ead/Ea22-like family protein [Salmonella enterica subsp. enterica serovar Agama]EHF3811856.1 ead/Ea22-like family protein [Salmonella enterica subsp. enterica serovar Wangata]HDO8499536.1 ead/Ea22-like family protein [Salmonella enterica subsp. enterica serovar Concord]
MTIDKQALRQKAVKAGGEEWQSRKMPGPAGEYTVIVKGSLEKHPGWTTCRPVADEVIDKKTMDFIAAANPATMLALLDELDSANGYASAYEAEKWHYHGLAESEGERADRAEKQVEEFTMWIKRLAHSLRNAKPDSKLHGAVMGYLSRKGLISVEDVLR